MHPSLLFAALSQRGVRFYTGVPDSLLKSFLAYLDDNRGALDHVIAANEGAAVALAAGHYLACRQPALVYMQNSGLGNAVNPLASLADPEVYGIPMLLLIGWRGEPDVPDEPQHRVQGKATPAMLNVLGIPFAVLDGHSGELDERIRIAIETAQERRGPYALLVRKGAFEAYEPRTSRASDLDLQREDAIRAVLEAMDARDVVVATTGKTSREVFELRAAQAQRHDSDFLTVGCMGHASQIALGVARGRPQRSVYCIDGDGAVLMHMGALAVIGTEAGANFRHVIINNGAHDSVGGQPTAGFRVDFCAMAKACGYKSALRAQTHEEIVESMTVLRGTEGPVLLEIRVRKGGRPDLGRPTLAPSETRERFMRFLEE